jgi:hypothetical protein
MFRRLSLAVAAVAMLGAGSAQAATGFDPDPGPPTDGVWTLTPNDGGVLQFECSLCRISDVSGISSDSGVAYTNLYVHPEGSPPTSDSMSVQRQKFFGPDFAVLASGPGGSLQAGVEYTTGNTPGIMVKQGNSTFFFDRFGGVGALTFSFLGTAVASNVTFVPIPAAVVLMLTALAGLFGFKRFQQKESELSAA